MATLQTSTPVTTPNDQHEWNPEGHTPNDQQCEVFKKTTYSMLLRYVNLLYNRSLLTDINRYMKMIQQIEKPLWSAITFTAQMCSLATVEFMIPPNYTPISFRRLNEVRDRKLSAEKTNSTKKLDKQHFCKSHIRDAVFAIEDLFGIPENFATKEKKEKKEKKASKICHKAEKEAKVEAKTKADLKKGEALKKLRGDKSGGRRLVFSDTILTKGKPKAKPDAKPEVESLKITPSPIIKAAYFKIQMAFERIGKACETISARRLLMRKLFENQPRRLQTTQQPIPLQVGYGQNGYQYTNPAINNQIQRGLGVMAVELQQSAEPVRVQAQANQNSAEQISRQIQQINQSLQEQIQSLKPGQPQPGVQQFRRVQVQKPQVQNPQVQKPLFAKAQNKNPTKITHTELVHNRTTLLQKAECLNSLEDLLFKWKTYRLKAFINTNVSTIYFQEILVRARNICMGYPAPAPIQYPQNQRRLRVLEEEQQRRKPVMFENATRLNCVSFLYRLKEQLEVTTEVKTLTKEDIIKLQNFYNRGIKSNCTIVNQ